MLSKTVYFRFDFGGVIGRGHLSRCMALAQQFEQIGWKSCFIIRDRNLQGSLDINYPIVWLKNETTEVTQDPSSWIVTSQEKEALETLKSLEKQSVVIVDHYALNSTYFEILKKQGHFLVSLQDWDMKIRDADLTINYNLNAKRMYSAADSRTHLYGPQFTPLGSQFQKYHQIHFNSESKVGTVCIHLGGISKGLSDKLILTTQKIQFFRDRKIIWITNSAEEADHLKTRLRSLNLEIYYNLPHLVDLYLQSDLVIGSCGISFLERACLGLWQLNFVVADNQTEIANHIKNNQLGYVLGDLRNMSESQIIDELTRAFEINTEDKMKLIHNIFNLIDGQGARRIVESCLEVLG